MGQWLTGHGLYIFVAVAAGSALFILAARLSRWLVEKAVPKEWQEQLGDTEKTVSRVLTGVFGVAIALAVTAFVVSRFNVDVTPALQAVGGWLLAHGVIILVILFASYISYKAVTLLLPSMVYGLVKMRDNGRSARVEVTKRAGTLSKFITNCLEVVIITFAAFMILSEIGVDIAPLLAGAGVVGIAIGFGAQKLIGDLINGFFIVLEDYYSTGDVVNIAGIGGLVEDVNLRRTVLRDLDGIVHIVPNGGISTASNLTRNWSRVNLNVSVAYGEDLDKVIAVLNRVGVELSKDERFGQMIITPPQVLRVDHFGDSGIEIKVLGDTKPIKQWDVAGELRKRIKKAFDDEGIEIPWPHTKVYFGNSPADDELKQVQGKPHKPPAG